MVKAIARRREGFTHDIEIDGGHTVVLDEPESQGGNDAGTSPVRMLGAALAGCTAITIEMYAERKGWELGEVSVEVGIEYDGPTAKAFAVTLQLPGGLTEEQQLKLRTVAAKCPVHKALHAAVPVTITDRVQPA